MLRGSKKLICWFPRRSIAAVQAGEPWARAFGGYLDPRCWHFLRHRAVSRASQSPGKSFPFRKARNRTPPLSSFLENICCQLEFKKSSSQGNEETNRGSTYDELEYEPTRTGTTRLPLGLAGSQPGT